MSAGTEGFIDTRLDTNHIGAVIGKILEARKLAETEREYAERQAEKYQTSVEEAGYGKGYFFKQALRFKFGGEYKQKKLAQLNTFKQQGKLLKTAISGKSGQNKLDGTERTQALFEMFNTRDKPKTFRDKFKDMYSGFVDDPMTRPQSKLIDPSSAKKIQKATTSRGKSRVNKEDILSSLSSIAGAIEKVAQSISEKNRIVSEQMIHSSALQGMVHTQLRTSGDTLEDKLQKIIDVLSNQTQLQSRALTNDKNKTAESNLETQKDSASSVSFDDLTTKKDESKMSSSSDAYAERDKWRDQMMSEMMSRTPEAEKGAISDNTLPKAEKGGIFSGPDSGYLAELHGNEMVVPLNNNYTQGEPSAVDGKVRPKPTNTNTIQKFETGTKNTMFNSFPKYEIGSKSSPNSSPITAKFGFDIAKNQMGIAGGGTKQQSNMTQSMVDVMSLPMMAAGGTILSATTRYMQSLGAEGANISPEIERIARPIAETFGLPPSIVNKTKQKSFGKSSTEGGEEGGESGKNILAKLMDGFGAMLDKMKENINNPPPGTTDTGAGGNGPGGSGQDFATLATVAALESGSAQGQADVAQSVYNRLGDTGQGYGKSITEILTKDNQYQPAFKDPNASSGEGAKVADEFKNITDENSGAKAIMYYHSKRNMPISEQKAIEMYRSSAKAISDDKLRKNAVSHVGGRTDFLGRGLGGAGSVSRGSGSDNDFNVTYGSGTQMARGAQPAPPGLFNTDSQQNMKPKEKATTGQLGQAITGNYGLKVGQERTFIHPEYGEIKAHKTTKGFDFYKNNTILNVSPSTPQGKSIVDYFKSTEGGIKNISAPKNNTAPAITPNTDTSSTGSGSGNIAMLNIGGGSKTSTAGSSSQPTGENGTESGRNPTQNFYSNSFSIGVG